MNARRSRQREPGTFEAAKEQVLQTKRSKHELRSAEIGESNASTDKNSQKIQIREFRKQKPGSHAKIDEKEECKAQKTRKMRVAREKEKTLFEKFRKIRKSTRHAQSKESRRNSEGNPSKKSENKGE